MIYHKTSLDDALVLELEKIEDERGFFARTWCKDEFNSLGLEVSLAQCSVSFNHKKGTLRGMHFQLPPYAETKLVRCTHGSIFDVIIDLRASSPTYRKWTGVKLSSGNRLMLYIPQGFAHGFQTLEDQSEVLYFISKPYSPESAGGICWNDPFFQVDWPQESSRTISAKDQSWPPYHQGQIPWFQ
ncbi:MAG: dTDP-4-dehydrorhamnose 3,5-epimerase [Nitrospirales bacterium]|nr:MAG: dTDP-4-dehydrorhamnose 3,5-epimerase [Nitrospirales bacterium]